MSEGVTVEGLSSGPVELTVWSMLAIGSWGSSMGESSAAWLTYFGVALSPELAMYWSSSGKV